MSLTSRFAACAVLALLVPMAPAQRTSSWGGLQVPGGVNTASILQRGKLLIYQEAAQVRVFSAFTRRWQSRALAAGAQLRQANDWLLITEGNKLTAFSSMRGRFATLTVGAGASVVNPGGQRNDSLVLVFDTGRMHAFSGLTGRWTSVTVGAMVKAAVQRHVAVVADGVKLWGISAFDGRWVGTTSVADASQVFADGTAGLAITPGFVHGFSAQRGTWSSSPALAGATLTRMMDVAVWSDANQVLAFSGLRGSFSLQVTGARATVATEQQIAVATTDSNAFLYSAVTGTWARVATTARVAPQLSAATAVFTDGGSVHAYSGLRGSTATITAAGAQLGINAALGYAIGGGKLNLFSAMTGRWHPAPSNARVTHPRTSTNAALLQTTSGYSAFSARTGSFFPQSANGSAILHVDAKSSLVAIEETNELHVFAPGRERWISTALRSSNPSVAIWRTTLIAVDERRLIGFGSQSGEIETATLSEQFVSQRPSSEIGHVTTANWLWGYSPVPDLVTFAQFPEFRRVFSRGSKLDLQLHGPVGAAALGMLGRPTANPIVLPIGTVFLDPPSHVPFSMGSADADGRAAVRFDVPDAPQLIGLEAFFQAAVLPKNGGPYLSRMCSVSLF